jgi:UDP-2,3-diacylglucosamine pyrophosphatase LpxH
VARRLDGETDRLAILSDMHRGKRDRADDFLPCVESYLAALSHYEEEAYRLVLLGDVEELWKNRPREVVDAYPEVYAREAAIHASGRLLRLWGNHDEDWASPQLVAHELQEIYGGTDLVVGESVLLELGLGERDLGSLFIVHGHQGTGLNDSLAFLARFTVRFIWKPIQHLVQTSRTTPSANRRVREKHNRATRLWAERHEKLLLITGHTHRPVFASISILDELERRLGVDIDEITHRVDDAEFWDDVVTECMERGWLGDAAPCGPPAPDSRRSMQPSLFNSGCCCYQDGRITGLEISDGEIRLVLWSPGSPDGRRMLARAPLERVFERID